MSGKRTGLILSILCIIGLFLLLFMYGEAQEQQRIAEQQLAELLDNPIYSVLLGGLEEPNFHLDILLGAIIVVGISMIVLPLIGFWYDEQTKDESKVVIKIQKQDLTTTSGLTNPTKIIISFIIALLPVIAFLIVWSSIMNTPDANPSGSQQLEYLVLQIAVSGMLFIPTFRGVYSFLSKTR